MLDPPGKRKSLNREITLISHAILREILKILSFDGLQRGNMKLEKVKLLIYSIGKDVANLICTCVI